MHEVAVTRTVGRDDLAGILRPRDDLVLERVREPSGDDAGLPADGSKVFDLVEGPFRVWVREVRVEHPSHALADGEDGDHRAGDGGRTGDGDGSEGDRDGAVVVHERLSFELAVPIWGVLFVPLVRRTFRQGRTGTPWWAPPARLDRRSATVLGLLCTVGLFAGYMGTLLTQTNTFFKEEFGASDEAIGQVLAAVRVGALLALVVVAFADRSGRRRVLAAAGVLGCVFTALGALSPGLVLLAASQTVARAFSASMALLVSIVAVEETPAGSRAYAVSVLVMTGALGAGGAVLMLWVADLGVSAWRVLYLVPLLALWPMLRLGRRLPETKRFEVAADRASTRGTATQTSSGHIPSGHIPSGRAAAARITSGRPPMRPHLGRLVLLAVSGLGLSMFFAPAAGFLNEYLRSEHGFSATTLIAFQILTNTPGGIGIVVGGKLADARGRRLVGGVGLAGGAGCVVLVYLGAGWSMWVFATVGAVLGAMAVPALAVYGPELFPTALRGRANGIINLASTAGSATGLVAAGVLADRLVGGLGASMSLLVIGPVMVVALLILLYPETASRELEELNPDDAPLPPKPREPEEPRPSGRAADDPPA